MKKIKILLLLSAALLLMVCGCKKNSGKEPTAVKLEDGEYEVYYLTQDGFHLETEVRKTTGSQPEELARELVKIMQDPEQKEAFLDFCYRYDSNPYVCGMGKDNLVAMGEIGL